MFQVPPAVIRPTSKAQFHRAAEAMLRMIAVDLNLDSTQFSIESSAGLTSTMGSVCMVTPALRLEVFMDNFSRAEAPRLMYRDRFNAATTRHKWISDLDLSSRTDVIVELRNLARAARPVAQTAPVRTSAFSRLAAWLA
jgi:hypothetical protein